MIAKILVSTSAVVVIVARLIWPELKVDAITLGLVIVAVLPWLTYLIESAKFPGGWEVKFRDVQRAGGKIIAAEPPTTVDAAKSEPPAYAYVAARDPNLAIVGLRIEIEKRIRALGERIGLRGDPSIARLFVQLRDKGVLQDSSLSGLQELIQAGNNAAHGASVEPSIASWALDYGPQVLAILDAKLKEVQPAG
jgi:hypothetical protein